MLGTTRQARAGRRIADLIVGLEQQLLVTRHEAGERDAVAARGEDETLGIERRRRLPARRSPRWSIIGLDTGSSG